MSAPRAHSSSFRATKPPRVAISLPRLQFGPRWFSFLIVLFCLVDLYLMLNMDPFIVRRATILGNERLSLQEIENVLGANNLAATVLNPAQIEYNILASFPEVATAQAQVNLPAELQITIKERTPVASWTQDNQTVWIDSQGFAFAPRGEAPNLITISATGAPPQPSSPDSAPGIGAHAFMTTQLMSAITTLAPSLPDGASLVFDPQYGLGWIEPGGCKVYFGNTYLDTPLKLQVVQAILKHLAEQELKPALISVAYPNAPFYRLATP
jgi:cell division protein FtsQ